MDNLVVYDDMCRFIEQIEKSLIKGKISEKSESKGVTKSEEHYLAILASLENPTFTSFSKKAGITRPAATQIIGKFIKKGYVIKVNNPEDKREYFLRFNDCINEYLEKRDEIFKNILNEKFSVLSEKELQDFLKILKKLLDVNV